MVWMRRGTFLSPPGAQVRKFILEKTEETKQATRDFSTFGIGYFRKVNLQFYFGIGEARGSAPPGRVKTSQPLLTAAAVSW